MEFLKAITWNILQMIPIILTKNLMLNEEYFDM
jgi:hypothetical protein